MRSRGRGARGALAVMVGMLVFAGTAAADRGGVPNGGREDRPQPQGPPAATPPETPPGQERRGEDKPAPPGQEVRRAPTPRRPAAGEERGRRAHGQAAPRRRSSRPAVARSQAQPQDGQAERGNGQERTRVCHATGAETNPYVLIEVASPALDAHRRHGDLVPAPAAGCPDGTRERGSVDICHATGSESNPYVLLEDMPLPSLNGHGDHEGDIIPAPESGVCAAGSEQRSTGAPPPGVGDPRSGGGPRNGDSAPASGVLGAFEESATPPAYRGDVAGATTGDGSGGSLPFTGLQLLVLIALGAAALALGGLARTGGGPRPVRA